MGDRVIASYAPSLVTASLFGVDIGTFSDTEMITISQEEVSAKPQRAMDGSATMYIDPNQPFRVKLTLMGGASENSWLHLVYKLFLTSADSFSMPLYIRDRGGDTSFFCTDVYFEKVPDKVFSNDLQPTEWVFLCFNPTYTYGSNVPQEQYVETLQMLSTVLSVANFVGINVSGFASQIQQYEDKAVNYLKGLF